MHISDSICPVCLVSRDIRYRPRQHNCICDKCGTIFNSKDSPRPKGDHTHPKATDADIIMLLASREHTAREVAAAFGMNYRHVGRRLSALVLAGRVEVAMDIRDMRRPRYRLWSHPCV